jgi:hypothetical protein
MRLARRPRLGSVIERLADMAGRTGEGVGHLPRGFVHEIGDAGLPLMPYSALVAAS